MMADNDLPWITSESCFSAFIGEDGGLSYLPPPSVPTDLEVALHCNQDSLRQVPLAAQDALLESSDSLMMDHFVVPSSSEFPGPYKFKVGVAGSAKYLQLEQEQLLVTNKSSKFAVSFEFACQPPEGCVVSAVVLCAKEADMQKLGSVRRCKKHVELEGPSAVPQFLVAHNAAVRYGYKGTHEVTSVPLSTMNMREDVYSCTYSCMCYNSCYFGRGNTKGKLVIAFNFMSRSGDCMGRAVLHLRCCAGPNRDAEKKRMAVLSPDTTVSPGSGKKRTKETPAKGRKQSRSSSVSSVSSLLSSSPLSSSPQSSAASSPDQQLVFSPPPLPPSPDDIPDEEGNYTFTWKIKDRNIFNMMKMLKRGYELQRPSLPE